MVIHEISGYRWERTIGSSLPLDSNQPRRNGYSHDEIKLFEARRLGIQEEDISLIDSTVAKGYTHVYVRTS